MLFRKETNHECIWDLYCGWLFTLTNELWTLLETNRICINF